MKKNTYEDMLVSEGLVTQEQMDEAIEYKKSRRVTTQQALMELNMAGEEDLLNILSKYLRIPIKYEMEISVDTSVIDMIDERLVREHEFFPFGKTEDAIQMLVKDPLNIVLEDEIKEQFGLRCEFYLGYFMEINSLIDRYFVQEKVVKEIEALKTGVEEDEDDDYFDVSIQDENSPIVKIVNSIFKGAVQAGASDIHIGPNEKKVIVRYRVDGILQKVRELPKKAHAALVSRIKTMGDMDITEKRKPQDGRIQINLEGHPIDMRVSILPSVNGEKVTIRLLDKGNLLMTLKDLGFTDYNQKKFENLIETPVGIILITGPTGSGKSSTLYTVINELNDVTKNIITIEDPVEYKLENITQVQVNPKAGLTFADGLRSILRQDPDIILIGEIRDNETAKIAVKASNTGHKVLATLHTNDALSSVMRLVDMGVENYLVASTIQGVSNQRLVRRVCEHCKVPYESAEITPERVYFGIDDDRPLTFYVGTGCENCKGSGFKGRVPIQELLVLDDEVRRLITEGAHSHIIREAAIKAGMKTLKEDGLEKALAGFTTLEEVKRYVSE